MAELRKAPLSITRERLRTPYEKAFLTDRLTYTTHDDTEVVALFSWPAGEKEISIHPFTPHTTPEAYKERVLFELAAL